MATGTETDLMRETRGWLADVKMALLRLEAAVIDANRGEVGPVDVEMAALRAVWARCPLPKHEMGGLQVHMLINGVWETEDVP